MNERVPEHRTYESTVGALLTHLWGQLELIRVMEERGWHSQAIFDSARQHIIGEINYLRKLPRDLTVEQARDLMTEHHTRAENRRTDFRKIKGEERGSN